MIVLLFISFILITFAQDSDQSVVTGFDCESTKSGRRGWAWTKYGPDGGAQDGFGSSDGRLFEFDCQTNYCRDSEGDYGHWWVTCGYSWKKVDELSDSDQVIVDVKTEASNSRGSCFDNRYTRALDIDSTGSKAKDSQGDRGHWGFWFCYRKESWANVKSSGMEVVTDLTAQTSSTASECATTRSLGNVDCYAHNDRDSCLISLDPRQDYANSPCVWREDGFSSNNKCEPQSWADRYANGQSYENCLRRVSTDLTLIGQWDTHNGGHAKAYGDNKKTRNWMYFFSKKKLPLIPAAQCSTPTDDGVLDYRRRYQDTSVLAPAPCSFEIQTRECSQGEWGTWSGSFAHSSCDVIAQCFNPPTSHGDSRTRTRYQEGVVDSLDLCISETQVRICSDGQWSSWSGTFAHSSCDVRNGTMYFWDNDWPSDTNGGLDATVLFAQSQIFPSKHGIAGDSQPHLTARRKALVLFRPHVSLSGDVSMTVRDIDGNTLSTIIMNEPKDLPKQVGWIDVQHVPEFPSSLDNPYVIQYQANLNRVNDPSAVFLASKFLAQHNYEVEVKYWVGSWSRNLYLPNGNDVPAGSKVRVICNSGYKVHVKYPNTVTGGWREKILSKGKRLTLVLNDDKVWLAESDLKHNAYLFGRNFYSTTLEAEWIKSGMTLEFQQADQVGILEDLEIGAVTEVLIPTIDAGFLTSPRGRFHFAEDATAHREYFQTLPVTRLVVAQYEPLHLTEVMLPTGKLYQTKSDGNGGWHTGDMRQFTGKVLLSHGINLANYGIFSSSGRSERSHTFTCAQMTAHNTRGVYQNGVRVHGGSGGNGIVTLDASLGNEFSHELGHNYGLGHYPGGFDGSVHRPANEIDSTWQWDSDLNRFTPNFEWKDTGSDRCLRGRCQSAFLGKYRYGTDSMASGGPMWKKTNRFTFYTPYTAKRIQDFLESRAVWDPTSSTGFRKFNSATKEMAEFVNKANGQKVPHLYRVPVTTIVGYYDPDANRRLQSYIFPALYGAYGFVYDDEVVSGDKCSLHVETATRDTLIFELSTNIDSKGMNKFHVNVATEWGATKAEVYCQDQLLATRVFEGPQNPDLAYTVNGVPFDDASDLDDDSDPFDDDSGNGRRILSSLERKHKLVGNGQRRLMKQRKL